MAAKYNHVIVATGQSVNRFPAEYESVKQFILQPQEVLLGEKKFANKKIIVIGGGAVAVDVCAVLKH